MTVGVLYGGSVLLPFLLTVVTDEEVKCSLTFLSGIEVILSNAFCRYACFDSD